MTDLNTSNYNSLIKNEVANIEGLRITSCTENFKVTFVHTKIKICFQGKC